MLINFVWNQLVDLDSLMGNVAHCWIEVLLGLTPTSVVYARPKVIDRYWQQEVAIFLPLNIQAEVTDATGYLRNLCYIQPRRVLLCWILVWLLSLQFKDYGFKF